MGCEREQGVGGENGEIDARGAGTALNLSPRGRESDFKTLAAG